MPVPSPEEERGGFGVRPANQPCKKVSATETTNFCKFQKMNKIWPSTTICKRLKIKLYHSIILPCLLYASETWRITVKLAKKLNAFHQRCLRRILQISYRDHATKQLLKHCVVKHSFNQTLKVL